LGNSKKPYPLFCDLTKFNGLGVDWPEKTFVNPPYDLQGKTAFVKKAFEEYQLGKTIVMLLPVSTSTKLSTQIRGN
jgi:DNA N-6-adenine-methyltransferase (Dam)